MPPKIDTPYKFDDPSERPPDLRAFTDHRATRQAIFDQALSSLSGRPPIENDHYRLSVTDVKLGGPTDYSLADQKKAILSGRDLSVPIVGMIRLEDKRTNQVVDERAGTLGRIPWMTPRGTFIRRGVEYTVAHQTRLKPGVYARQKESGELEAHFNPEPRTGRPFRIMLEPESGKFRLTVGQSSIPLGPLLLQMGISREQLADAWGGHELVDENLARPDARAVEKIKRHLGRADDDTSRAGQYLIDLFGRMRLDPMVTGSTLKREADHVDPALLLRATQKLINIQRGDEEVDDRDSLAYQTFHSVDDMVGERIKNDAGGLMRRALWKATGNRTLKGMDYNLLEPYFASVFTSSLANPIEEINPLELLDQQHRVTRLGEGGISDSSSVPMEARTVQPSHFLYIDPIKTPESDKLGVDTRLAYRTYRRGRQLVTPVLDRRGRTQWVSPEQATKSIIAFPGELESDRRWVRVMDRGRLRYADRREVEYTVPDDTTEFTPTSNLVPMRSGVKGQRLSMGARMLTQALPLREGEAPLVQALDPETGRSFEHKYGEAAGAVRAAGAGKVEKVEGDRMVVRYAEGGRQVHELAQHLPFNRRVYIHNRPLVRPGDQVQPGQLLAASNYTDDREGTLAIGKNLLTAYADYRGLNYEDALVISESAAKKLASEHMYQHQLEPDEETDLASVKKYRSLFPTQFNRQQLANLDPIGVVRPGTVVHRGDPLILATGLKRSSGGSAVYRPHRLTPADQAITWEYENPGEVTDVTPLRGGGYHVAVKSYMPAQVGDKLANRYGSKGIISAILPDDQMLRDQQGNVIDLIMNAKSTNSRVNPAGLLEAVLAKAAYARGGEPYVMPGSEPGVSRARRVAAELRKQGVHANETVYDPMSNRRLHNIMVGRPFIMKLHHMGEDKQSGRGGAGDEDVAYTAEQLPARGGESGSKRLSVQDINALIAHGAINNVRDAHLIRGQRNDDFWKTLKLGGPLPSPRPGFVHDKFFTLLRGAGVNVTKKGNQLNMMALTDQDILELSAGPLRNDQLVDPVDMTPREGGLFDRGLTGGHDGRQWTHVPLTEPMPNPVMEQPIRKLLGLTQKELEGVISGSHRLADNTTGPHALLDALKKLNVDKEIERARHEIKSGRVSKRDDAIKRLGYLTMMRDRQLKPEQLMWNNVPVVPPAFRPIIRLGGTNTTSVADANQLYRDLMHVNTGLSNLLGRVPDSELGDERLAVYNSLKAVAGLGDPVGKRSKDQKIHGLLSHVFGRSPKWGIVQRQLISRPQDTVGRGVVIPDPGLDIDQVGLPHDMAWSVYAPFVMRRLVREGTSAQDAAVYVSQRRPEAARALDEEMRVRPVLINRAPTLHRFSVQAAWPVLAAGTSLRIPPLVTPGFNADFDGDQMNIYLPISDKAVNEAVEKMMPSRNILDSAKFEPYLAPRHEFLYGLAVGSGAIKRRRATERAVRQVRVFRSAKDAIAAFRRGELDADDPLDIVGGQ